MSVVSHGVYAPFVRVSIKILLRVIILGLNGIVCESLGNKDLENANDFYLKRVIILLLLLLLLFLENLNYLSKKLH